MSGVIDPNEAALAALGNAHEHAAHTRKVVEELRDLLRGLHTPARLQLVELSQMTPIYRDEARDASLSLGIINPTAFGLRLGLGGGSATATARGFPVPATAAVILPITAEDLEVGLEDPAAVGDNKVVCWLLRFDTVQPFHLHRY